ncbi:MAG: glycosyltransferase, partial [Lachnospiraceae bacterium]|nr:glycosyltransferase [Lachnospiraceae bacterium]
IYMCWDDSTDYSSQELRNMVLDFYKYDLGENEIYWDHRRMGYADGVVATSWQSAYVLNRFHNCKEHFYFVQDFEPWFYPKGSLYFLSENTYKLGYKGFTAGLFLADKLKRDYGMECFGFRFSYDRSLYSYHEKKDDKKKIFFYARPYTARREFELGVLALTLLYKKHPDLIVVMAGQSVSDYPFDFPVIDKGVMAPDKMSELYGECDMCLVLSATNLSLLPLEVMASGSVVVSDRGEHNEWELNDDNSILCDADPWELSKTMDYYFEHRDELIKKRKAGREYAERITWEQEIDKLSEYIIRNINSK